MTLLFQAAAAAPNRGNPSDVETEALTITIYDKAQMAPQVRRSLEDGLRRIFQASGITVDLVSGDLKSPEATLVAWEAMHVGTTQEISCHARHDIAVDVIPAVPPSVDIHTLGRADPFAKEGLNVRVFEDHVRDTAFNRGQPEATVLAHVIAHEIGHVLLRSRAHTEHGLMSAVWTGYEFEGMRTGGLFFNAGQSAKMLSTLSTEECPGDGVANLRRLK